MSVEKCGQTYFRTLEACREAGVSRATLFRWIDQGFVADAGIRDRNGWRLFTAADIAIIKSRAMQFKETHGGENERRNRRKNQHT
ncbi:MAG: MerR family transcriptional regulator [Chloroflexi bacterium]|nr:MerR family transcriptional regulator [Chloroflexota bacterium]